MSNVLCFSWIFAFINCRISFLLSWNVTFLPSFTLSCLRVLFASKFLCIRITYFPFFLSETLPFFHPLFFVYLSSFSNRLSYKIHASVFAFLISDCFHFSFIPFCLTSCLTFCLSSLHSISVIRSCLVFRCGGAAWKHRLL